MLLRFFWHWSCKLIFKVVFSLFAVRPRPDEEEPALKTTDEHPHRPRLTSRPTVSPSGRTHRIAASYQEEKVILCNIWLDWTYLSITCMEWYGLTSSEVLGHRLTSVLSPDLQKTEFCKTLCLSSQSYPLLGSGTLSAVLLGRNRLLFRTSLPAHSSVPNMDLHRAAFKMESSSYLPNPLASPALMVLASTAEASRDASIPCQQPRPFGVPVSVEKDVHLPFNNGSYTFASMYHRQGAVPPGFPNRDFPPSLLHLHHQFAPPNLDCSPISMLNHSGVGAFRPFASPEDRDGAPGGYQSAFTPAKRLKGSLDAEASPHLRYSDAEGKEYDFGGAHIPPGGSPSSALKAVEDSGKKIFAVSGLLSDRETSSSPEDRIERCK